MPKISQLPQNTSPSLTDILPEVSPAVGGTTYQTTFQAVYNLFQSTQGITPLSLGGTSANLTANNGGIFYSTASAGAILSGTATANQILLSGSTAAPSWSTATYPATTTINQILYSSSNNVIGGISTANDGVLITSNAGVPSFLANSGTAGFVLTANAGAPPSWKVTAASGITEIDGNTGTTTGPIVTIEGLTSAGTLKTSVSGTILSFNFNNGNNCVGIGDNSILHLTGAGNTAVGAFTLTALGNAFSNSAFGFNALNVCNGNNNTSVGANSMLMLSTGAGNTAIGSQSLENNVGGSNNISIGYGTLINSTGSENTFLGTSSGSNLTSGNYNIAMGYLAGNNWESSESSNIAIGSQGVTSESNVLRIGDHGTGNYQQSTAYIAGITGNSASASTAQLTFCDSSSHQLTVLTNIANGVLISNNSSVPSWLANSGTAGFVLTANSGAPPSWQAPTGAIGWTTVTTTSQSMSSDSGYTSNNAGLVTLTLPTISAVGDVIYVAGLGAGGWKITQNASQLIHYGNQVTTTGTGGSLASANQYDIVTLRCLVANTTWTVMATQTAGLTYV